VAQYIPDQVLDRIRQATDIVALLRESLPLKRAGSAYKALCPFHREKTPSFHVNPERQIFTCFGCGEGGDVFSFVMKTEGVSFFEAASVLAERAHIELPKTGTPSAPAGEKDRLHQVNAWAAEQFHHWLVDRPVGKPVLQYLEARGVDLETVKRFQLGYSPDSWDTLLKTAKQQKQPTHLMARAGLLASKSDSDRLYDRFRNRLMFPIRDVRGRVIGFGARALDNSEPKYLNSPETPLFSKGRVLYAIDRARDDLREKRQAIVVEGYMDAITAHQYGVKRSIGVLGTALTRDHVRTLRRYVDEVVLIFYADNAGLTSASRSLDAFAAEELSARVVTLPDGLDPDDFLRRHGAEAFLDCVRGAVDGITHKLNRALEAAAGNGGKSTLAQSKALDDVLATVALMPNPVAQSVEIKKIAERTKLPEQALRQRLERLASGHRPRTADLPARPRAGSSRAIERELLLAMLTYPDTVGVVQKNLDVALLRDTEVRVLIQRFLGMSESAEPIGPADLLARTQEEPHRRIIEEIIGGDPVQADVPQEWCRELINEIEARAHEEKAGEYQSRVASGEAHSREARDNVLMAKLDAVREAHRSRGKWSPKRNGEPC